MSRELGIMVDVIERVDALNTDVVPAQVLDLLSDFPSIGIGVSASGQGYAICTEGVHWKLHDSNVSWLAGVSRTEMDSAEYVRTFGDRLNSNHYSFVKRMQS